MDKNHAAPDVACSATLGRGELRIDRCADPLMWYAGLVGQRVPLMREDGAHYWSREPSGCINIVHKQDATVVAAATPEGSER